MTATITDYSPHSCLVCQEMKVKLQVSWQEGNNKFDVTNDSFCRKHAEAYIKALLETYGNKEEEEEE